MARRKGNGPAAGSDDDIDRREGRRREGRSHEVREPWTGEGAGTGGGIWSFGRGLNGPLGRWLILVVYNLSLTTSYIIIRVNYTK